MTKKVAVIQDLSGFGKCSLTAAIPVLSVMGVQCCPLATAVLTGQTGYTHYHLTDLTDMMHQYTASWKKNNAQFEGIYTGFLTGSRQIQEVTHFLDSFRQENTFLLVDPVMGDDGKVFGIFSPEFLEGMTSLCRQADLITPNLMEACLLGGVTFESIASYVSVSDRLAAIQEVGERIRGAALRPQDVVITGIKFSDEPDPSIYNLAITADGCFRHQSHFFAKSFSGTGDLFASALCGGKIRGLSTADAMALAGDFLLHSIADTMESDSDRNDGVEFERHLGDLIL